MARHAALKRMILMMSDDGIWISHLYMPFYPKITKVAASQSFGEQCHICENALTLWRYEDECTGLRPREVAICPRCGIVADYAWPLDVTVIHDAIARLDTDAPRVTLRVRNHLSRELELSFFLQANLWQEQRIAVDPVMVDAVLAPGQERELELHLAMDRTLADDVLALHVFTLTDRFDLSCFTRRLVALRRQEPRASSVAAGS